MRGAEILILDEPTAVLTPQETEELFRELKLLKQKGHTIVFISHKLKEVKEICDRITILRGGRTEGVFNIADVSEQEISRLMVGRDVVLKYDKTQNNYGEPVLSVQQLGTVDAEGKSLLSNISFNVRAGEIVGIAGVEGNGQSQLVEALTGGLNSRLAGGKVEVNGRDIQALGIREIRGLGVSYIPEDRMRQGAAGEASISDNLISTQYRSSRSMGAAAAYVIHSEAGEFSDRGIQGSVLRPVTAHRHVIWRQYAEGGCCTRMLHRAVTAHCRATHARGRYWSGAVYTSEAAGAAGCRMCNRACLRRLE